MARVNDFVDPEYDRKLAEYKAMKARMRQENPQPGQTQNRK
jgi:hypothetical protein